MWVITVMPEWIFHIILIIGIIGLILASFLSFIPFINKYKLPLQVISFVLFSIGLYLNGSLANDKEWQLRVSDLEKQVAEAKAKSEKVNTEVVTKVVTKNRIIKEKGDEIIKYVDREVVKYDNICPVPSEVVKALNAAAQNKTVEDAK